MTQTFYEKQVGTRDAIIIIPSINASQKLLVSEVLRLFNPFQPSVAFHIETSHDWFLYETQDWAEIG